MCLKPILLTSSLTLPFTGPDITCEGLPSEKASKLGCPMRVWVRVQRAVRVERVSLRSRRDTRVTKGPMWPGTKLREEREAEALSTDNSSSQRLFFAHAGLAAWPIEAVEESSCLERSTPGGLHRRSVNTQSVLFEREMCLKPILLTSSLTPPFTGPRALLRRAIKRKSILRR